MVAVPSRFYSSVARETTLTASISPSNTSISVAATVGFPSTTPYVLALDFGTIAEELVEVTAVAGLNLTVTRAIDGSIAANHNTGARVKHVYIGEDASDFRFHEGGTDQVHGLTGVGNDVVGTSAMQTLTNKTLQGATNITGTFINPTLYNQGASNIIRVIGDSTNPSLDRLRIIDNEISLTTVASFGATGALNIEGHASTNRLVVDNNGSTWELRVTPEAFLEIGPISSGLSATQAAIEAQVNSIADLPVLRVTGPAATAAQDRFRVRDTGKTEVNLQAAVTPAFQVRQFSGSAPGDTVISGVNNAGTETFSVLGNGTMTTAGAATVGSLTTSGTVTANRLLAGTSDSTFQATTAGVVASAGWTITTANLAIRNGVCTVVLNVNRSGATIGPGNIADSPIATLPSPYRPGVTPYPSLFPLGVLMGVADITLGFVDVSTLGVITTRVVNGAAYTSGNQYFMQLTFLVD